MTAEYRAADGGKTAVYMLRWVNTRGEEKGPWSEVTTATVAAYGVLVVRFVCCVSA